MLADFLLLAFAFFGPAVLRAFFAAGAADALLLLLLAFDDVFEAAFEEELAEVAAAPAAFDDFDFEDLALPFDAPPAAFFFGEADFFFGADFALVVFDFGFARRMKIPDNRIPRVAHRSTNLFWLFSRLLLISSCSQMPN